MDCLTYDGIKEGGGSLLQSWISTYAIAKSFEMPYFHTFMKDIEHNYNRDPNFDRNWNNFLEFPSEKVGTPQVCSNAKNLIDNEFGLLLNVRDELKEIYQNSKVKTQIYFNPQRLSFALHIRKINKVDNDLTDIREYYCNPVSKNWWVSIIEKINTLFSDLPIDIHIYSQGEISDFPELNHFKSLIWHLDEDVFTTLTHLIEADVLVMAKSSFSYVASILSDGEKVIHNSFWHKLMPETQFDINQDMCDRLIQKLYERISKSYARSLYPNGIAFKLYEYYEEFFDWYVSCELNHKQFWIDNIKKNWTIIDAGANVGIFSLLFGSLAKNVIAVEPCKETVKKLKKNLYMNNIHNVRIINKALSENEETKNDKIYHRWGSEPLSESFEFTTLDSISLTEKKIDAIKVDVDSYDYEVIKGGKLCMVKHRPVLTVEITDKALSLRNANKNDVLSFMERMGYTYVALDDENHAFTPIDWMNRVNKCFTESPRFSCFGGPLANNIIHAFEFDILIRLYDIDTIIETGTHVGDTTEYLARAYPYMKIISCETDPERYHLAEMRLEEYKNVEVINESSVELLPKLKGKYKNCLYFLDAHWEKYLPLLDELKNITTGVVCIHDFDINNPRFGYDVCGENKLCKEYILSPSAKAFPSEKNTTSTLPKEQTIYCNNENYIYENYLEQQEPRGRAYIDFIGDKIKYLENFRVL